ncbi:MAG: hypothetical protein LBS03_02170 [Bacteroidales bacterium]|nr:hypothetical protein [Bacteroidales bacterium]
MGIFVVKKHVFHDKIIAIKNMESIDDKIVSKIKKCGRGKVFLPADFADYGAIDTAIIPSEQRRQKKQKND